MIFHENRLLADESHVISVFYFYQKLGKIRQNLSSAAVVIGALRVNFWTADHSALGPGRGMFMKMSNHMLTVKGQQK